MEEQQKTAHLTQLKKTASIYEFIFNKVLTEQFYPEEFAAAHEALIMCKSVIEKVNQEIKELEKLVPECKPDEGKPDEGKPEQGIL